MTTDIVIPERLVSALRHASFDGENECGAWALFSESQISCDPWSRKPREKLILRHLRPLGPHDIDSASPVHLTVRTAAFMQVLKEAARQDLMPGFLHGHPSGYDGFSDTDDQNERALLQAAKNRVGPTAHLVSLLCLPDGPIRARLWRGHNDVVSCPVTVSGKAVERFDHTPKSIDKTLDRQSRVFGETFNQVLRSLRVLVVGAGGTGSPLTIMLARAGVKHLVTIDPDTIEDTNLHRLHGVGATEIGAAKSLALAGHIRSLGLGTHIVGVHGNIIDPQHQDLLKSADIVFCATDDHAGRMLLNRFAYFYDTPVIDLGLAISKDGRRRVRDMTGRVSLLYPGAPCLLCRNIVDPRRAREEELKRRDPENYGRQVQEGYIIGGGDPEPAFIAMTTSVACMALEEFTQMLSGYRGNSGNIRQRLRRFQMPEDRISGGNPNPDCPLCAQSDDWGVGDTTPFLDRVA